MGEIPPPPTEPGARAKAEGKGPQEEVKKIKR